MIPEKFNKRLKMKKLKLSWMKIGLMTLGFALLFTFSCSTYQGTSDYSSEGVYNLNDLNAYGDWIYINPYGEVWQPFVVDGWMPFDNGHWAFADGNWTWISYEPFGWIVYHYGDWYDDPFYGWVWIPGDGAWSPANVLWIDYGDYIGWAPLPPRGIEYGRPWEKGQERYWHVVRMNDFTKDDIHNYRIVHPRGNEIGSGEILDRPPGRTLVEKYTAKPVPEVNIPHETVRLPQREFHKMNLPPVEHQRVEQHSPRVRSEVLVPRDEFHRHHSQITEQRSPQIGRGTVVPREQSHGQSSEKIRKNK